MAGGADALGRTVSNTWSSADTGGAYTAAGGSASDYAVGSSVGKHTLTSVNVARETYLTAGVLSGVTYAEATWTASVSAVATGAELISAETIRRVDASNLYRFEVVWQTDASVTVRIR
jgi:hypothetical protein